MVGVAVIVGVFVIVGESVMVGERVMVGVLVIVGVGVRGAGIVGLLEELPQETKRTPEPIMRTSKAA